MQSAVDRVQQNSQVDNEHKSILFSFVQLFIPIQGHRGSNTACVYSERWQRGELSLRNYLSTRPVLQKPPYLSTVIPVWIRSSYYT